MRREMLSSAPDDFQAFSSNITIMGPQFINWFNCLHAPQFSVQNTEVPISTSSSSTDPMPLPILSPTLIENSSSWASIDAEEGIDSFLVQETHVKKEKLDYYNNKFRQLNYRTFWTEATTTTAGGLT